MPTNKTYSLTTLADVFEVVTLDNVHTLVSDLKSILFTVANAKMAVETMGGKVEEFKIDPTVMWTDDNICKATTKVIEPTLDGYIEIVVTPTE